VLSHLPLLLADVRLNPNTGALPGSQVLQKFTNGLAGWSLVISLIGLLLGAAVWALGAHGQNYHQATNGRRAVLVSGAAALLVGAAPVLINFFFHAGRSMH